MRRQCLWIVLAVGFLPAFCALAQNEKETWFCLIDGQGKLVEARGTGWFLRGNTATGDKTFPFVQLRQIERIADDRLLVTKEKQESDRSEEDEVEEVFAPTIGCAASSLYGEYYTEDGLRHSVQADELFKTYSFIVIHGELKYNPDTKRYYPPTYIYDPYTRKRLEDWNRVHSPLTGVEAARVSLIAKALANWIAKNGPVRMAELHEPRLRNARLLHSSLVELFGAEMDELLDDAVAEAERRKLLEEEVVGTGLESAKMLRAVKPGKPAAAETEEEETQGTESETGKQGTEPAAEK